MDDRAISSRLSVEAWRRIESACTRFEDSQTWDDRFVASLLNEFGVSERQQLLCELAGIDIERRVARGDQPIADDYLQVARDETERQLVEPAIQELLGEASNEQQQPSSDRYQFLKPVGSGGVSVIWAVQDRHAGRPLAVKLLQSRFRKDAQAQSRLQREALLTGSLQHPGIPPVYDHGRLADGNVFFAMKLVQGETLEAILKRRSESETDHAQYLGIFEQVAQTLAYAHSQGIVHRDLKPQNVMVGRFGEVQVMDWGMAKKLSSDSDPVSSQAATSKPAATEPASRKDASTPNDAAADSTVTSLTPDHDTIGKIDQESWLDARHSLTAAGDVLGTPCYMPPEQARGEIDSLDQRSDVFGLGAILFEVLTYQRLYRGTSAGDVLVKAAAGDLTESLQLLEETEAESTLRDLCERCISIDRDDRPADAGVVNREITDYLISVQEKLRKAEIDRREAEVRASEESKRRRSITWMAIAVATVSILGTSGVIWQWQRVVSANRETQEALRLADERFAQAQGIVDDYLTQVASTEGILDRTPGTQSLRRTMLEKARDYYEQFLAEAADDPSVRYQTAQAYARLGEIAQILDPAGDETFEMYGKAEEQYRKLIRNDAERPEYRSGLADAHGAIGEAHFAASRFKEAIESYSESAEIWTDLVIVDDGPNAALGLAKSVHNIGHSKSQLGDKQGAEPFLEQAIELSLPLLESHGKDAELVFSISNIFNNAGTFFGFKMKRWKRSLELYEKSMELRETLVEIDPESHRFQNALGAIYNNRALALYQLKRIDEAREDFLHSAEVKEKMVEEYPSIVQYARELGNSYTNLSTFFAKQKDPAASIAFSEKSAAVFSRLADSHPQVIFHAKSAIDVLGTIVELTPFTPKGRDAVKRMAALYSGLLEVRPGSKSYIKNLTLYSILQEDFSSAVLVEMSDPIDISQTKDSGQLTVRAIALYRDGQMENALAHLQAIPTDQYVELTQLAAALVLASHDDPRAAEYFETALKTKKTSGYASIENQLLAPEVRQRLQEMQARIEANSDG